MMQCHARARNDEYGVVVLFLFGMIVQFVSVEGEAIRLWFSLVSANCYYHRHSISNTTVLIDLLCLCTTPTCFSTFFDLLWSLLWLKIPNFF